MKRYEIVATAWKEEDSDGEFVRFKDAQAEIDRLNKACDQRAAHEYKLMCEIDALKAQRDVAIQHIAEWCVAIQQNGDGWDDWGQYYKDACRDNALHNALPEIRSALNAAIAKARGNL